MAVWQFTVSVLEYIGEDENNWPITRIVENVYKVPEDRIIRLNKTLDEHIKEKSPSVVDYCVLHYDRIDKKTGKTYPQFDHRKPDNLKLNLSDRHAEAVSELQERILSKLPIEWPQTAEERVSMYMGSGNALIQRLDKNTAYFSGHGPGEKRFMTHEYAQRQIKAVQRFYDAFTPTEIDILNMKQNRLKHRYLELLREYGIKAKPRLEVNA